jgi:hypothetical protein
MRDTFFVVNSKYCCEVSIIVASVSAENGARDVMQERIFPERWL